MLRLGGWGLAMNPTPCLKITKSFLKIFFRFEPKSTLLVQLNSVGLVGKCPKGRLYSFWLDSVEGQKVQGGGGSRGGIFRCGKFRISNVCEISRSIFRPLCEIKPLGIRRIRGRDASPPPPPFRGLLGKRPLDASSFMDLRKKRHRKETRK